MCAELANALCGTCSTDCDLDGTPDACELDVRGGPGNGANGVPDDCEPTVDCNRNGIEDALDIALDRSFDCDRNGQPDECQISTSPILDLDTNGVLDACEGFPCAPYAGSLLVGWAGPPDIEQPWESDANWVGGRPGWDSQIVDAFVSPAIMDAGLHCDQRAGSLLTDRTENLISLSMSTLMFRDATPDTPGSIVLMGSSSLLLDPRRGAVGSSRGRLETGTILSPDAAAATLLTSSPFTDIVAYQGLRLSGCEIQLRGITATKELATGARSTMDARGVLCPEGTVGLTCKIGGTLRAWRTEFDPSDSMRITSLIGGTGSERSPDSPRVRHESEGSSSASMLLIWDWFRTPNTVAPVMDLTDALPTSKTGLPTRIEIKAALQLETSLASGRVPRDGETPTVRLVRQAAGEPVDRYDLIIGTPTKGRRFVQEEVQSDALGDSSGSFAELVLRMTADSASDPVIGAGLQQPISGLEVGKVALDLDWDGVDEILVAVRVPPVAQGLPVTGKLRSYRVNDGVLIPDPSLDVTLTDGAPIVPWDGAQGDGQPLDVGDFDGDGHPDLAVACDGGSPFRLFRNFGNGLRLHGEAANLSAGQRATCVAVIPAPSGNTLAPASGGFVGGVQTGKLGSLQSYLSGGGTPNAIHALAGVPRTARGGGTVGTQGVGIATGGSTKSNDVNLIASSKGFIQWVPTLPSGTIAAPLSELAVVDAPCDIATLVIPNEDGQPRICIASTNPAGSTSDMTIVSGSGSATDHPSGFWAVAPLKTASGAQGARSVAAVNLFEKPAGRTPDLLVVRADGRVVAARTDIDNRGSVSLGYLVTLAPADPSSAHAAVGGVFSRETGRRRNAVIRSKNVAGLHDNQNMLVVEPLPEGSQEILSADLDGNGFIDFADVNMALLDMGPCVGCAADLDQTGMVDFGDITLILLSFGEST
jgi:hypothetical protein